MTARILAPAGPWLPLRFAELRRAAFGPVVRRRRMARGLTPDTVAGMLGISVARLTAIEEKQLMPDLDAVFALADVLGTDAAELLHDTRVETECLVAAQLALRPRYRRR